LAADDELELIVGLLAQDRSRRVDDRIFRLLERELKEAESILEPHHPRFKSICSSVRILGSPGYRARVEKALAQIASTRAGQRLFAGLEHTGRRVTIRPSQDGKNHARPLDREDAMMSRRGIRGPGTSATVRFDPDCRSYGSGRKPWMRRPPYVGLFHELIHASDYMHGALAPGTTNGKKNCELSAVGLPYDHDCDPTTPMIRRTDGIAENDLRAEVGLPLRKSYGSSSGASRRRSLWNELADVDGLPEGWEI
jgi:hypothetical protein